MIYPRFIKITPLYKYMSLDKLASDITQCNDMSCVLLYDDITTPLYDITMSKYPTPVDRPTRRGGVYLADKYIYKIKATCKDVSIVPLLTGAMLGPSTEFKEIELSASINSKKISIFTNLTNSMQSGNTLQLDLVVLRYCII